jgi:hypothetical protein
MDIHQWIVLLAAVNAVLAIYLVSYKKKEGFRRRVDAAAAASARAQAIDPGFGLTLGAMQNSPGVVGLSASNGGYDYDKMAQQIIEGRGTFGDMVSMMERNWEAPYIKNLP